MGARWLQGARAWASYWALGVGKSVGFHSGSWGAERGFRSGWWLGARAWVS